MRSEVEVLGLTSAASVLLLSISIGMWVVGTTTEMNTFNKFSKTKVTFWEAAFTDLRVYPDGEGIYEYYK